jgi:PEP-CTERM motif
MFTRLLIMGFTAVLVVCSSDAFAMSGGRRGGGGSNNAPQGGTGSGSTYEAYHSSGWSSDVNLHEDGSWTGSYNGSEDHLASAPEPGTILLLASGAAGAISWRRRRKK